MITGRAGRSTTVGALAVKAAALRTQRVSTALKQSDRFTVIGTPQGRIDALDAVTGRKKFTMDLNVPGAAPTMVCRPPTINGRVGSVANADEVRAMPGVTDVVVITTGVAVRARTFGQCIDAVRALRVSWKPGSAEGKSDETVRRELAAAELPLGLPPLTPSVEGRFTFHFRSNSALETNCAIADVRSDRAEVWSSLKAPIVAKEAIAARLGLPLGAVTVHVTEGAGPSAASSSSTPHWKRSRFPGKRGNRSSSCGIAQTTPARAAPIPWPRPASVSPTSGTPS